MIHAGDTVGPRSIHRDAVFRFLCGDFGDIPVEAEFCEIRLRMSERDVRLVNTVFQRIKVVAIPDVRANIEHSFLFQLRVVRKGGRLAFSQIGEDKTQIFLSRATPNFYFFSELGIFGRLLHALPGTVILPTVIEAADAVSLNPTDGKLRAAMRAPEVNDVRSRAFATIKCKLFSHDLNRYRMARLKLMRHVNRMPKHAQISPGQSAGASMDKIHLGDVFNVSFS